MEVSVSPTVYLSKDIFIFSWENEIAIVQMDMVWRLREVIIYIILCVSQNYMSQIYMPIFWIVEFPTWTHNLNITLSVILLDVLGLGLKVRVLMSGIIPF